MLKLDWNIIFSIVNIFVLYLLMKRFLFGPVTEIMEKRTNAIKASFTEAENINNEALKLKQEYELSLENAEQKAASIIRDAKQRALEEHDKQIKATKEEISKLMEDAKKSIELDKEKSMQIIQSQIAGIAILVASKIIQKNMDDSMNKQIINDFLAESGVIK